MTTTPDKDIVERLRAITERYPGFRNLLTDATDEIESLRLQLSAERAEVEAWRAANDSEPINYSERLAEAIAARANTDASRAMD